MKVCKEFKGDRPCKHYWTDKNHDCNDSKSSNYKEYSRRVLLIKLDALGDVIRCTPLAEGIKKKYPDCQLIWLTQSNSMFFLQNNKFIDKIVPYNDENVRILQCQKFDTIINLDKDAKATSMMKIFNSNDKRGYGLTDDGFPIPLNKETEYHYKICLDNWGLKLKNKKTYIEMMFDSSKLKYENERPIVHFNKNKLKEFKDKFQRENNIDNDDKLIILNTGCGPVYPHKKWTYKGYKNLIKKLLKNNKLKIVLTGSTSEESRNKSLYIECESSNLINTTSKYSIEEFCYLVGISDIVVTGDTMALHLGISLNKKIVTFFGPTPYQETDLFGLGEKFVRKELDCLSCHDQFECPHDGKCMSLINSDEVFYSIKKLI